MPQGKRPQQPGVIISATTGAPRRPTAGKTGLTPSAPPARQHAPGVLQPKAPPRPPVKPTGTAPHAPPVYRPQPPPRVLQPKPAGIKPATAPPLGVKVEGARTSSPAPRHAPAPPGLHRGVKSAPDGRPPQAAPPRLPIPPARPNVTQLTPAKAQQKPPHVAPAARTNGQPASPIQAKFASAGGVIQPARINKTKPQNAKGPVNYYYKNGTRFATDGSTHWYENRFGTWTRLNKGKVPKYNRFTGQTLGRGGQRRASFKSRMGSAASYSDTKRRRRILKSTGIGEVVSMKRGKRKYRAEMRRATQNEGVITTDSATAYAAAFGAPVIQGGYNWCHLLGHGGGGSDDPSNIVAASTHCNSEQLEIENIVYQYRNSGVKLKVEAERYGNAAYLASKIVCYVYVGDKLVYTRQMDAFRASKPSWIELAAVQTMLTKAITDEFK